MKKKIIAFWLLCAATSVWAQTNFMTETETNCYLQHKDEIDTRSEMASEDKFRELTTTYIIKLTYEAELRNICNILEIFHRLMMIGEPCPKLITKKFRR